MHLSAFTGFGNVSRSTIWGHITFFAMIFFWPSWRPPKVQIANFLEPTKQKTRKSCRALGSYHTYSVTFT